jgi:hypothetical protein
MKPMLAYLIVIGLQIIAAWEISKLAFKELCIKSEYSAEIILFMGVIIFEIIVMVLFNKVLYLGGFYRLPWGW